MTYTRTEPTGEDHLADFGHTRAWIFSRGRVQVRCLYRCRSNDAGVDDDELDEIIDFNLEFVMSAIRAPDRMSLPIPRQEFAKIIERLE